MVFSLIIARNIDLSDYLSTDKAVRDAHPFTTYDLVANIVHEGEPGAGKGTFKAHVLHKVRGNTEAAQY